MDNKQLVATIYRPIRTSIGNELLGDVELGRRVNYGLEHEELFPNFTIQERVMKALYRCYECACQYALERRS